MMDRSALVLLVMCATVLPCGASGEEGRGAGMANIKDFVDVSSTAPDGIWIAPHVQEQRLAGGVRVFILLPQHFVVVMPLPAGRHTAALLQLDRCDTGWDTLASTEQAWSEGEINSFRCAPQPSQARAALAEFNGHADTQRVLREVFNVTRECADIHTGSRLGEMLRPAPTGADAITVLTYPHSQWLSEWGGQLEFSSATCTDRRIESWDPPIAMRLTPRPDVLVFFSGPVIHRATHPNGNAPRSPGPPALKDHMDNSAATSGAAWRYSNVMQLTCYNDRFHGPYHQVIGGYVFKFAGAQYLVPGGLGAMLVCLFALMWREHSADELKSRSKEI
eukprot:CAMPEP_0179483462 /NCGR_PEP_ID=MMETSP0799-20121207/60649_1 /TAXON_ID=46947 /ORGANISM="Geminigera cryophila, Strain CCMP2564" /LENGTH=333 /DNA_ID=CAMNT_0021297011 /DNA_START=231 /DNA_END=1233 /DNA_ORIENTATION=+